MDPDFWRTRWENNQIGFHEGEPNSLLKTHFARLSLTEGARVFVPLCGKTRDIHWLLGQGLAVVGAELSQIAVEQLFDELGIAPEITFEGALVRYSAPSIDIFLGDVFALTRAALGAVDAVYDRAALVALPAEMRTRYAAHLVDITSGARQLLICFLYDQSLAAGPPFAVDDAEVARLYGGSYRMTLVEDIEVPGGLKGKVDAREHAWLLEPA